MIRLVVRLERAKLHPGVGLVFSGDSNEVLAQVPIDQIEQLLGHREKAYYKARVEPSGTIHLGEEVVQ